MGNSIKFPVKPLQKKTCKTLTLNVLIFILNFWGIKKSQKQKKIIAKNQLGFLWVKWFYLGKNK